MPNAGQADCLWQRLSPGRTVLCCAEPRDELPVFSIQSILLVALGFLSAGLVVLGLAPAFWSRAVRLTTKRLKDAIPVSEEEIRADKDRLRADFAIRTHKLEMRVEQAELQRARHLIEISRRDANVSTLERRVDELTIVGEEHQNARHVLEQTIADRLPRVEQRLSEAKALLFNRDREIADLTQSTKSQRMALDEATAINAQQSAEVDRMTNALTTRGARNQGAMHDPKYEAELALRSEIEALRAQTREQAGLIGRLQASSGDAGAPKMVEGPVGRVAKLNGAGAVATTPKADVGAPAESSREMAALTSRVADQDQEIVRLKAELMTRQAEAEPLGGMKDSRIALKARLAASEAEVEQQTVMVQQLRAELVAANERNALQAQHFMEEMRRLGAGTMPVAGQHKRPAGGIVRRSLAERVAQNTGSSPMAHVDNGADGAPAADTVAEANSGRDGVVHLPAAASETKPARPRLFDRIQTISKT